MARMLMALSLLCAGVAHADLISMSEASCRDATQGAACEGDTGPGTCQPGRCCRNDYSNGPPPKTVCRECLTCQSGAAPTAAPAVPEAAPEEAAPEKAPAAPEATPEKAAPAATPEEAAPEKSEAPAKAEKRGCDAGAGGSLGLGALAFGLLLALGLRRSRR